MGCAKNVAPSLSATAHNVELLGNQVRDYSVTVYLDTSKTSATCAEMTEEGVPFLKAKRLSNSTDISTESPTGMT